MKMASRSLQGKIPQPLNQTWHWQRSHTYLSEENWYISRNRGIYICRTGRSHSYI